MNPAAQRTYNNRYRIDAQLGNGGMAIVYSGTDTLLRRRVAIKVLRDQYASDDDFVRRFSYEAQAAAKLSHPNIVNVYDFGREADAYYIVMELVDGATLGDLLREGGPLPEPVAIDYAIQIASGLAYAHRQGLLHRDVKPANILVTQDDVVKLSDFGIARAVSEHTLGVTQPGMVMGSVAYISPEQAQGKDLDERSDLYSVGVVLYQMLVGALPFSGETPVAVALKHVSDPAPAIDPRTGVSPAVAGIVARLLRKDPAQRFSSATELASALREARERPQAAPGFADAPTMRFGAVTPPAPPPRPSAAPDRTLAEGEEEVAVEHRRGAGPWAFILPLLFLAAVAAGFFLLHGSPLGSGGVTVPDLAGSSATQAQQTLAGLGLHASVSRRASDTVPIDRVISQDPGPGTKANHEAAIDLVVSSGLPRVDVPDIVGYNVADAQRRLSDVKLKSREVPAYSKSLPVGQVAAVKPAVGESVPEGAAVVLTVSQGPKPIVVPNVVDKTVDQARSALSGAGLTLTIGQQTQSDTIPANTIASQSPEPGATLAPGAAVTVVVSTGAPPATVPAVVGADPASAGATLRGAGFDVNLTYDVEPTNATGKVVSQNPAGGGSAKKGSAVQIIVSVPGSVPDVTGEALDDAKNALTANGYAVGNVQYTQQPGAADGTIVRTEPEANTQLKPGESVNLTVNGAGP